MIRSAILAGLLVAITQAARGFYPGDGAIDGSGSLLAAGFLLLAAIQVGHVFHGLRLPHLTGYLLCGLAFGPQGLDLVSHAMLTDLNLIKKVTVGLIALLAGSQLDLRALAPKLRTIGWLVGASLLATFLLVFGLVFAFTWLLPETMELSLVERAAIALLAANVMCARSPPVVIGILSEAKAKGPLSELWVSVVVLSDLAVVVGFSLTSAVANAVFPGAASGGGITALAAQIGGSLMLGVVVGGVFALYAARVKSALGLFVFAVLFVVAEAGTPLRIDPLLVGLAAGLLLENVSRDSGGEVAKAASAASLPTFAVFFAVIGAEIHLDVFMAVAPYALMLALTRAGGMTWGTLFGARRSGVPQEQARWLPYGMLPQAGIAIALATGLKASFAGWGEAVGSLLLGTVVVNELVGPVAFRAVVMRTGEAGLREPDLEFPSAEVSWDDDTDVRDLPVALVAGDDDADFPAAVAVWEDE